MRGIGCFSNVSKNRKEGGGKENYCLLQSGTNLCSGGRIAGAPGVAEEKMEPNGLAVNASGLAGHQSQLKRGRILLVTPAPKSQSLSCFSNALPWVASSSH